MLPPERGAFVRTTHCLIVVFLLVVYASQRKAVGVGDDLASQLDKIFSALANDKSPGVAVLVRKSGRTIFERGYGVRDLRSLAKNDPQTNFRLASCSKQFTAMSIMLLVHEGKLRYDDKLTGVFPDFPAYGKNITIRNLLNHTSGLPDYEDLMAAAEERKGAPIWTPTHQIQDAEVLDLLKQESAGKFAPGTQWSYSNSGYVVLGLVVARVSGKPLREFLRERLFAPLRMSETVAYQKGQNEVTSRAYGHSKEGSAWKETDQSPTSATLGDGGIYSSLTDLAMWDEALTQHTLLSEKEMQPALSPAQLTKGAQPKWPANSDRPEGTPASYGFGWFLDPYRNHTRMWHYGDTVGFHTYIQRFPADRLTIIVLCNRTDVDPESLAAKVADLYLNAAH
jgi:CubicO group peptidase (beta-lactamase class C family)